MPQSAIRYAGRSAYVKDEKLRGLLGLICLHLQDVVTKPDDIKWITNALMDWVNDHESMPPGLRDIELDGVLTESSRVDFFVQLLNCISMLPPRECGACDKKTIDQIVQLLMSHTV
ncbi:hypothetical protein DES44_4443 [Roseateles depolymerans]|uniref:hypothetical protein n=1 Tax=Roseateles depolymerans TaxID=76731 RepID=UPI000E364957|nr:hypothetical protein [Roseateles depolymerans]REG13067.1 hypothetical protein DES44_4443 [Roseateles depolymerans]